MHTINNLARKYELVREEAEDDITFQKRIYNEMQNIGDAPYQAIAIRERKAIDELSEAEVAEGLELIRRKNLLKLCRLICEKIGDTHHNMPWPSFQKVLGYRGFKNAGENIYKDECGHKYTEGIWYNHEGKIICADGDARTGKLNSANLFYELHFGRDTTKHDFFDKLIWNAATKGSSWSAISNNPKNKPTNDFKIDRDVRSGLLAYLDELGELGGISNSPWKFPNKSGIKRSRIFGNIYDSGRMSDELKEIVGFN